MSPISDLWKLNFELKGSSPDATIVIPAYGAHEVTAECLIWLYKTILINESVCQVLLMDDCSPEPYSDVFGQVQGLQIIRNNTNLGFLQTCNASLEHAIGTDIILLNNDTFPVGLWIDHLRNRKMQAKGSLIVGARLVGMDGKLQESGGIIFSDGSGWNFGRGYEIDDPRCSYAREVDYCSGAALLIDGEFARRVGLFDEIFSPAYYEDTDLCFEARKQGGSVWIEPRATVIHREGVSHGTSLTSGIKRYQELNRGKFITKWSDVLPDQFPPSEQFVFRARARGNKKRILVIDEEVPRFDSQSGAFRIYSIMKIIIGMHYEVMMLPRNARRIETYTTELEALGVEVLGSLDQCWNYIVAIKEQIEAVWVSRPQVMSQFRDLLRKDLQEVPIVFDMVDLHQLREQREIHIKTAVEMISDSKAVEDQCLKEADLVVAVSDIEAEFAQRCSPKPVVVVSNVHQIREFRIGAPHSQTALFVGSFKHSPNLDGIIWFLNEVISQVIEAVPGFCLKIIGEDPPEVLRRYESENVTILGWVQDLDPLLDSARVSVSPLRFGAGVKGKISQALSFGLPVVTTSIGSEGMSLTDGFDSLIRDSADGFAEAVINLISDDSLWNQLSRNGLKTAESHFGEQVARDQIKNLFQLIDKGRYR